MPTSSTPLLGLALPVTGELSGTWGDVVNNSITALLDSAVAGVATVSVVSANQALTSTALIANEARNAILKLTTTTTANFSVFVPPRSKCYAVWNASIYTATIFCSTVIGNTTPAGTGVAIPPGGKVIIFTDGTDCFGTGGSQAGVAITSGATITPTISAPQYSVTALATTAVFAAPATGLDGQRLVIRIKDNGTAQTISWASGTGAYRAVGTLLPVTTIANKVTYVGTLYNAAENWWDVLSVTTQT